MKTSTKGFTPMIDTIRDDVGRTPALVYGAMYRFSKMSDLRVCTAGQTKIAETAGVGRETVINAQSTLADRGYIAKTGYTHGGRITWRCNVEITGEIIMTADLSEKPTRVVEKLDSHIKRVPKKEKQGDLLDAVLKYGKKHSMAVSVTMDMRWFPPDLKHHLLAFTVQFKARYKREPTKKERGYWISEVREWYQRGYTPKQVTLAWEYATENGTIIKSPRSITYAFDQLSAEEDEFFGEEM